MRSFTCYLAAVVLGFGAGCDTFEPAGFESDVVVEAYLIAGEVLPEVRLTRTIPIDETFNPDSLGISGADVRIELLGIDGGVEEVHTFRELQGGSSGIYVSDGPSVVRPLRTYRLVASTPQSTETITSVTTVPDTFSISSASSDSVVYQSDESFTFFLTRPDYPGRQNVFVISTTALEPRVFNLTPLAEARYENSDITITRLSQSVSPLLNEENFNFPEGDSLRVRYPWLGLNFYGPNEVTLQVLDDNMYDFLRSQSIQQGGSTLPPGEIPNVLEHVDGGRGIFGSFSEASVRFVVLRGSETGD